MDDAVPLALGTPSHCRIAANDVMGENRRRIGIQVPPTFCAVVKRRRQNSS
jgi:hypothetical protein